MGTTYRVVTLDGQEHGWLDEETVHQWYLRQYLRDLSYVLVWGANEWKPLYQVFDVRQWQQFEGPAATQSSQPLNQASPTAAAASANLGGDSGQLSGSGQLSPPPFSQGPGQPGFNQPQPYGQPPQQPMQPGVYNPQGQWTQTPQYNYYQKPAVFASARAIGIATIIGVIAVIVTRLIHLLTYYGNDVYIMDRRGRSTAPADVAATAYLLYGLFILVFIVAGILYCLWVYRAYKNLRALGHLQTDFTPGWAVGWFFVPVVNLWKPFQAVQEIWVKSDPSEFSRGSGLIAFWWVCFLITGFANWIGAAAVVLPLVVISMIAHVIAAILLIAIIIGVDRAQEARAKAVDENPEQFSSSVHNSNPYSLLR